MPTIDEAEITAALDALQTMYRRQYKKHDIFSEDFYPQLRALNDVRRILLLPERKKR